MNAVAMVMMVFSVLGALDRIFGNRFHQWIVWCPPRSEKASAFSINNQIHNIGICSKKEIFIKKSLLIPLTDICKAFLRLWCYRTITDSTIFIINPLFRESPKIRKQNIQLIL